MMLDRRKYLPQYLFMYFSHSSTSFCIAATFGSLKLPSKKGANHLARMSEAYMFEWVSENPITAS
jgi:hypothetical protein